MCDSKNGIFFTCSQYGNLLYFQVRVIAIKTLRDFWKKYTDAEDSLRAWYAEAKAASWKKPADITRQYRTVSILKNNRAVFNIKGNDYRLVVAINYAFSIVYIRFVGTHKQYDRINSEEI